MVYENTIEEEEAEGYIPGPGILDLEIATLFNLE